MVDNETWLKCSVVSGGNEGQQWQEWRENSRFDEGENTLANDGLWWLSPMPGFGGRRGTTSEGIGI